MTKPKEPAMVELKNLNETDLKDWANAEHQLACDEFLEHARRCGRVLRELHRRIEFGKWKPWVEQNCTFSYPTASNYMRVAKRWNDPLIKEARESGQVDSIQSFLDALQAQKHPKKNPQSALTKQERQEDDKARRSVCTMFKKYVADLTPDELHVLNERFDDLWFDWHAEIQKALKPTPKADAA
jgi:hypothetical protein